MTLNHRKESDTVKGELLKRAEDPDLIRKAAELGAQDQNKMLAEVKGECCVNCRESLNDNYCNLPECRCHKSSDKKCNKSHNDVCCENNSKCGFYVPPSDKGEDSVLARFDAEFPSFTGRVAPQNKGDEGYAYLVEIVLKEIGVKLKAFIVREIERARDVDCGCPVDIEATKQAAFEAGAAQERERILSLVEGMKKDYFKEEEPHMVQKGFGYNVALSDLRDAITREAKR